MMFRNVWNDRIRSVKQQASAIETETAAIDRQIGQLVERIVATQSSTVIGAYERKVEELERQKLILAEKISRCGTALPDYDESLKTPIQFLDNPLKLWNNGDLVDKSIVLSLAFKGQLVFDHEAGFQTP